MMMVQCFAEKFVCTKYGRERNDTPFDRELNSLSNDVVFSFWPYFNHCLQFFFHSQASTMIVECFGEKLLSRKYGRERNDTPFHRELNSLSNDVVFFSRPYLNHRLQFFFR
jgi:hypothetical protein